MRVPDLFGHKITVLSARLLADMPEQNPAAGRHTSSKRTLWIAFAAVYLVWGSTYLAIKYAVQTIPPYLMGGSRFLVSGLILFLWARARGAENPSRREWRDAAIVGTLLLCGGNGAVAWAEQRVPSGITALLVASVPLWMVVIDWLRPHGKRPPLVVGVGLIVGLGGVAVLALPGSTQAGGRVDPLGALMLLLGSISWAAGSIYSRHGARPASAEMATALQMIAGSVALFIVASVAGELGGFHSTAVSRASFIGWAYLVTFGALVGFTAYIYLLRETTPAKATTYAYVNPIVAVVLGWMVAGEPITPRTVVAAAIILASVALITLAGGQEELH
jgi:drug/metabolite transporter (DMT)-like permease